MGSQKGTAAMGTNPGGRVSAGAHGLPPGPSHPPTAPAHLGRPPPCYPGVPLLPRSGDTFLSQDQVVPYCLALLEVFRWGCQAGRAGGGVPAQQAAVGGTVGGQRNARQHAGQEACMGDACTRPPVCHAGVPPALPPLPGWPRPHVRVTFHAPLPCCPAGTMARGTTARRPASCGWWRLWEWRASAPPSRRAWARRCAARCDALRLRRDRCPAVCSWAPWFRLKDGSGSCVPVSLLACLLWCAQCLRCACRAQGGAC